MRHSYNIYEGFASELISVRAIMGMTQEELAEASEISLEEIEKIEQGTGNPTFETLNRLAKGLKLDLVLQFHHRDKNNGGRLRLESKGSRVCSMDRELADIVVRYMLDNKVPVSYWEEWIEAKRMLPKEAFEHLMELMEKESEN